MYEAFNIVQHYGLGDSPRMVRHFGAIEWRFSVDRAGYVAFVSSPESAYTDYARRSRNSHPLASKLKNIYFARFRGFGKSLRHYSPSFPKPHQNSQLLSAYDFSP
jgi:hypothetical protein